MLCLGGWLLVESGVEAAPETTSQVLSLGSIATVGGGNALSTPAARHLVRMESGTYLIALQRDLAGGSGQTGLGLYRSDDDAQSWTFYGSLNASAADRHTVDLLKSGDDVALVQSFDAPSILPDTALDPRRKVYFQWWRSDGNGGWSGDARATVFNPAAGEAYHRGELAIDDAGRIWVQAFKRRATACDTAKDPRCALCNTAGNGDNHTNDLVVSVSTDGGLTFAREQVLATTVCRAGGRLINAGQKLLMIWNDYSGNEKGTRMVTSFVTRDAADPLGTWSAPAPAFPDEPADGIYHGAAMSAVAEGGSVHLVYKDQNQMRLWYRRYDVAAGSFGPRILIDDGAQDWALQPATVLRNGEVFILANHLLADGRYETRMWRLSAGLGAAKASVLASENAFHGYPSLPETLPGAARTLPYVYTRAATSADSGEEMVLRIAAEPPPAVLSLEAGRAVLPAGRNIGVRVQTTAVAGGPLTLDISGLPPGAHASFDREQVPAGEVVQLNLWADAGAKTVSGTCVLGFASAAGRATLSFRLELVAAPAVAFRGPLAGAVIAGVTRIDVDGTASAGLLVSELQLVVDGSPVATASSASTTFDWDSGTALDGAHDLSAVAVDELGNSTRTEPVRIEVRNHRGGCASAGAGQPLLALALLLAALRRNRVSSRLRAA
jgi:hypothetical protein